MLPLSNLWWLTIDIETGILNAGVKNASTVSSLLHCPSQKLIVPVWFGWSGSFVKPKEKKAPSVYQSSYQHIILERSLPSSCLGTAFHSTAANPRHPCPPDKYLLTFSISVMFASFLPQDPFSYYLYFNNTSSLYLTNFRSCMWFSRYRFAHLFLAEHTSERAPSTAEQDNLCRKVNHFKILICFTYLFTCAISPC